MMMIGATTITTTTLNLFTCKLNSLEANYKVSMRKKKKTVKTLTNKIQNKAIFIIAEEVKCFVFKYLVILVYFMILSPNNVVRIWNRFWFLLC